MVVVWCRAWKWNRIMNLQTTIPSTCFSNKSIIARWRMRKENVWQMNQNNKWIDCIWWLYDIVHNKSPSHWLCIRTIHWATVAMTEFEFDNWLTFYIWTRAVPSYKNITIRIFDYYLMIAPFQFFYSFRSFSLCFRSLSLCVCVPLLYGTFLFTLH